MYPLSTDLVTVEKNDTKTNAALLFKQIAVKATLKQQVLTRKESKTAHQVNLDTLMGRTELPSYKNEQQLYNFINNIIDAEHKV